MKYAPRRERASARRAKSSRATERGIAGHQAAMAALGTAAGGWERTTPINNDFGGNSNQAVILDYDNPAPDGGPGVPGLVDLSGTRGVNIKYKGNK